MHAEPDTWTVALRNARLRIWHFHTSKNRCSDRFMAMALLKVCAEQKLRQLHIYMFLYRNGLLPCKAKKGADEASRVGYTPWRHSPKPKSMGEGSDCFKVFRVPICWHWQSPCLAVLRDKRDFARPPGRCRRATHLARFAHLGICLLLV